MSRWGTALVAMVMAGPLVLTACGSGERDTMLTALRTDLNSGGLAPAQVDCVMAGLDSYSTEELLSLNEDTPSPETEAKASALVEGCVTSE